MNVFSLFPYPLMHECIEISQSNIDFLGKQKFIRTLGNDGWLSDNKHILNDSNLVDLKANIQKLLDHYVFGVLKFEKSVRVNLLNSWIVKHGANDSSVSHNHFNSLISGIVYLNVSETSGQLVFERNPMTNLFPPFKFDVVESNMFNSGSFSVTPSVGDVVIFPSIINHSVTPNFDNIERLCIAFNAFIDGSINTVSNDPVGLSNLTLMSFSN